MKKYLFAFLFLATSILFAQEPPGIHASVELVSGAKQNVQFLGIHQDTVNLGGTIKGVFTVVKIHRERFKSIVDDQGNDLLNKPVQEVSSPTTVAGDSSIQGSSVQNISVQDSSLQDSAIAQTSPQDTASERQPTFLDSVEGKHIFVALERRSIDSSLAYELNRLSTKILQEQGVPVVFTPRTNFGYCREQSCIKDSLAAYGAASVFIGSISAAKALDSLNILMSYTVFEPADTTNQKNNNKSNNKITDKVNSASMTLSSLSALSDAIGKDKLSSFIQQLLGKNIKPKGPQTSYIHVETDPEGANLEIAGGEGFCKTPCTYPTLDTGKIVLYAYWNVDRHIWAAKSVVKPIPGDTNKISLKLKKAKPELYVTSSPVGAEIYPGSAPLTKKSKPIGRTPSKYPLDVPGLSTVQLRKEGFRDTSVTIYAPPTEMTTIDVQMEPLTKPEEILQQQEWLRSRKKNFVGHALMGSAIAPILVGALITYLAVDDYDEAKKIKNDLKKPAAPDGAKFQKLVDKNHDLVDSGDRKMIVGGSLVGAGILLFGVGFTLSF